MSEDALARLARLAQAARLPGVEPGTSYGDPALKVGGKGFAAVKQAQLLSLRIPIEHKELLLTVAPDIYFETDHYKGWPWLLVRLDAIGDEELTQRLIEAWRFRAPGKLTRTFDAG